MMDKQQGPMFREVLKDLGESSSLHAIPKIVSSRQIAVKALWGLLLCGTTGLFCYQFIELLQEYLSYPIKTSVSLKFNSLDFPAITICNANPFRRDIVEDDLSDDVEQLLSEVNKLDILFMEAAHDNLTNDIFYGFDYNDLHISKGQYDGWKADVLAKFASLQMENRTRIGHQLKDFVQTLTFSGAQIRPETVFTLIPNNLYGNCFTMFLPPTAVTSGQDNGITIVLNLEIYEYFEQFTQAYGAKLLIHQGYTYPLPDREGYILAPGYETNVGLKLRSVHHLGGKYSECQDAKNGFVVNDTTYDYSVALCHSFCDAELVLKECNCVPIETPTIKGGIICTSNDSNCIYTARKTFVNALNDCKCHKRCEDDIYITSISGRAWPVQDYFERILMIDVCEGEIPYYFSAECLELQLLGTLSYESYKRVSQNFLKVNIFFEDFNYEDILEEPMYPTIRFVSDVGGALGLFMGASLLTFVEILQFILEVVLFLKGKHEAVKPGTSHVRKTSVQPLQMK